MYRLEPFFPQPKYDLFKNFEEIDRVPKAIIPDRLNQGARQLHSSLRQ
jgi:hypothetical protein